MLTIMFANLKLNNEGMDDQPITRGQKRGAQMSPQKRREEDDQENRTQSTLNRLANQSDPSFQEPQPMQRDLIAPGAPRKPRRT